MSIISQSEGTKPHTFVIANKCKIPIPQFTQFHQRFNFRFLLTGDMEHQRAVPTDKQTKFANERRLITYNVSTRTGENVII